MFPGRGLGWAAPTLCTKQWCLEASCAAASTALGTEALLLQQRHREASTVVRHWEAGHRHPHSHSACLPGKAPFPAFYTIPCPPTCYYFSHSSVHYPSMSPPQPTVLWRALVRSHQSSLHIHDAAKAWGGRHSPLAPFLVHYWM